MSLLDQAANNLSPYKMMISEKAGPKDERKFIIQPNILVDILKDEMSNRVIDKKARKEFASYRTKLEKVEWRLSGILNFVDEPLYREQIGKTIESMLKHIRLRQPNGDWVVTDFEVDVRPNRNGDDAIMLAVKFVDTKNEQDLQYQNGVPLVDVKVDVSGSNKELIEAIQAQGSSSNDQELKDLMKQFIAAVATNGMANSASVEKTQVKEDSAVEEMPSDFEG
tara:strand:+ start:306 stop:974 length:669 start_codon:yes stop_codon:yes gene_type:complete